MHYDEALGKSVDLDCYRQDPDDVVTLSREASFHRWSTLVKQPEAGDKTLQGIVLATKPAAPDSINVSHLVPRAFSDLVGGGFPMILHM